MSDETFCCEACGDVFPKAWSDEAAETEMGDLWGDLPASDRAVICDDCFNEFMPWMRENHPGALT